ncbi:MAG: hypothetical protein EA362_07170 [Saprospirales bacterium]|nr:MAG: hypothetical protein EA362_07170 [Saprospirales bacterium]
MVKFRMNHGSHKRGDSGRKSSSLRYVVILIALLLLFVWLLTVNMEPWLAVLLGSPEKSEIICSAETGELKMIDDLILAPAKDGSGVVWMAHGSAAITNFGHRPPFENGNPFRMPLGLTEFWSDDDMVLQFSNMDVSAFRIFEEVYNQIFVWHEEYGDMHVVSGMISCIDSIRDYPPGENIFVAIMNLDSESPYSLTFLWANDGDQRPLNELVFSLAELNSISGLNIFEDLITRKGVEKPRELPGILSLGYNTTYFETRVNFQRLEMGD